MADWATGLFGAALVGLLWAPWFTSAVSASGSAAVTATGRTAYAPIPGVESFNGWQAMAVDDIIFCIAGLLGAWLLVATTLYSPSAVPIAAAAFAIFGGLLASVLVVIRLIWPPDLGPGPTARNSGVWLALDAAIGLTVCALASMRDERRVGVVPVPITELPTPRVGPEGSGA